MRGRRASERGEAGLEQAEFVAFGVGQDVPLLGRPCVTALAINSPTTTATAREAAESYGMCHSASCCAAR
ncbi:hypothetical protein ADZ36_21675 [Streptomyces fradiae]|uniref:Uncharacterized protein n=1 Tax=Streptomyces fradiae TaxID=1906 RepID=A0ACC4W7E6_STRFR|nr:hypothetical protein ADZ36_21675 [Streptomyces fradiae]OFA34092.1 hypothetical protein BEN35_31100 [Streptomyces fradiae]